jgi:hypothetical protein
MRTPPPNDRRLCICVVGDCGRGELAEPLAELRRQAACRCYAAPEAARAALRQQGHPWLDALLLLQTRPGDLVRADVERLLAAAPLARTVALVGPWCEGEGRSGRPLAGVVRVPWRSWRTRLAAELGLAGGACSPMSYLPRTATDSERLLHRLASLRWRGGGRRASVRTHCRQTFESLAAALSRLQIAAVWQRPSLESQAAADHTDLVLVDGWECAAARPTRRGPAARSLGPVVPALGPPEVLLLAFPRPDDALAARAAGFEALVAQPCLLTDLAEAICACLSPWCRANGP